MKGINVMKKKIILTFIAILCISIFLVTLSGNNNSKKYTNMNGIKLAISDGNGSSLDTIPAKGMYKVTVSCNNADGSWDYINWKIIVKNITGDVKCNLTFKSMSTSYLNSYIIGLDGTTQGTGKVVHEIGSLYSDYTAIAQSGYSLITPAFFTTTWSSSITSGTEESSALSWDSTNGYYVTNPTQAGKYYYYLFKVTTAGNYQMCYKKLSGGTVDYLYRYKNTTNMYTSAYLVASSTTEVCIDYFNLKTSDTIRIAQKTGSTVASLAVYLKKAETTTNIDTGYRYEGKNPNNYIRFNDELWRIIGVFDSDSHGVSNTNLVKIIKEDSIGRLTWYNFDTNNWVSSTINHLLNGAYYDWETNSNSASTYCYGDYNIPTTCDYSENGIKSDYRSMIENVTWYLGGAGKPGYTSYDPISIYEYERDANSVYSGRSASTPGYIGLMYESDYLYGALSSSCSRTTVHGKYSSASCAGNNWLYGNGDEWTISPYNSSDAFVEAIAHSGNISYNRARYGCSVKPVLYLVSSVYKYDGDGSITNPYIIGM